MKPNKQIVKEYRVAKDKLSESSKGCPDSLALFSASYEDRCSAAASTFKSNYHCMTSLIFYNKEFLDRGKTSRNLAELSNKCSQFSDNIQKIETSIDNKLDIVSSFNRYISENQIDIENKIITLDISTFPRHELLLLLRYLRMLNVKNKIRILYAKPKKYGNWLSTGFKEVIAVPSFGGTQIPGRKKLLIILSGFEWERMFRLWEEHEPSNTVVVIGDPPTNRHFLAINKVKANLILSRANVIEASAAANNPFQFFKEMEKIMMQYKREYNIFVSPMNTKIQVVGLFLLFEKYSWFQITMAIPNDYNVDGYSDGAESIYEFFI